MRHVLLAALVALVALTGVARAQFPGQVCYTNDPVTGLSPCSDVTSQLLQYARQALQLNQEITTALQEVQNTLQLPRMLFQDASSEISEILGIARQADLLVGNTGQFISNLSASTYPVAVMTNPMAEVVKQQNAIALAIKQLGTLLDIENPNIANKATILSALSSETMTADGRLKALQDAGQVGSTVGQQLQGMETIMLGMAQGQHATMLADRDLMALQYKALDVQSSVTYDYPTGPGF